MWSQFRTISLMKKWLWTVKIHHENSSPHCPYPQFFRDERHLDHWVKCTYHRWLQRLKDHFQKHPTWYRGGTWNAIFVGSKVYFTRKEQVSTLSLKEIISAETFELSVVYAAIYKDAWNMHVIWKHSVHIFGFFFQRPMTSITRFHKNYKTIAKQVFSVVLPLCRYWGPALMVSFVQGKTVPTEPLS